MGIFKFLCQVDMTTNLTSESGEAIPLTSQCKSRSLRVLLPSHNSGQRKKKLNVAILRTHTHVSICMYIQVTFTYFKAGTALFFLLQSTEFVNVIVGLKMCYVESTWRMK
jgi:hypothetical protein